MDHFLLLESKFHLWLQEMIPTYVFIIMCLFNKRLLTRDVNHGYKCLHVPSIYVVSLSASYSTLHGANQLPNEIRQARILGEKRGNLLQNPDK